MTRRQSRRRWIVPLVVVASLPILVSAPDSTLATDRPPERCQLVPDTWVPSLDQVRSYVEEKSSTETNASQQLLTQTSQNLADLRDAQLFITYVRLMQTLDVNGQGALFEEQKRWLDKRVAAARASVTSPGGTLGPLEYSGAFAKITDARLAELQQRLQRQQPPPQEERGRSKP